MIKNIIKLLHTEGCSCVMEKDGEIRTFHRRGVIDLYDLYETDRQYMQGASLADKVIGKGAAALIALGKMKHVFARVISTPALDVLRKVGIPTDFDQEVPHIINRQGDGYCPLELLCDKLETPEEMYPVIQKFVETLKSNH